MKVLCVAEKPSIAKAITGILSGGQWTTRNTQNQYIKNYDFSYRLPPNPAHHDFTVTAVLGHLTEGVLPEETKSWQGCDPFILFDAPITHQVDPKHSGIERNLLNEARRAQQVMIWTDCDREGEHIGSEIVAVCRRSNPNIIVKRARFSAIIATQIHNACRNPVDLDWLQAAAVEARMDLDLRAGAAMTRLQSLRLQAHFDELDSKVISYGPCQFPTLGFVVEQYERMQNFIAETFWYIHVGIKREDSIVEFKWRRNRLFDYDAAFVLYELCLEDPTATVLSVQTKPASKWKPLPLTTVELQKSGSRLLHLTPKRILDIAEGLYQKGYVSYPRTETDQFDREFNFHELIEKHTGDANWGAFATGLMNGGFERPRNGKKNDKAHPPIHTTAHVGNLAGDDKRVYDLITRRFLACCSKNATGRQTSVEVDISGEHFSASALVVLERNYLEVYPYDKWQGNHLPDFAVNETFIPDICELKTGTTTAPNLLTEADLVNLMDKNGIGTDATIAEHIAKIIDREYVMKRKEGRTEYLLPSTLGIGLVKGYDDIGLDKSLCKPHLRRETEQRMTAICEGVKSKNEVLHETLDEYRDMFIRTRTDMAKLIDAVAHYMQGVGGQQQDAGPAHQGQGGHGHGGQPPPSSDDDDDDDAPPPAANRGRGRGRGRAAAAPRGGGRGRGAAPPPAARQRRPPPDDDDKNGAGGDAPPCRCGDASVERTVTKESENKGRRFYICSKPREGGSCGFFEWCDDASGGGGKSFVPRKRPLGTATNQQQDGRSVKPRMAYAVEQDDGEKRCPCDLVAALRTATKEGPNQGRQFYVCSKVSKASQCKFFEWADGDAAPPRAQAGPAAGGSGVCYRCQEEGHYANACPNQPAPGGSRQPAPGGESNYTCFRCGEAGHLSTACTQDAGPNRGPAKPKGRGRGRGGASASASGGKSGSCYKCGGEGHWASACTGEATEAPSRGRGRGRARGRGAARDGGRGRGRGRGGGRAPARPVDLDDDDDEF